MNQFYFTQQKGLTNIQWWRSVYLKKTEILIHISWGLNSILFFVKPFLSVFKISKTLVFFLRTSSEYLTRYGQGSVFKIRFQGSVEITDPCLYFFEFSPDVLKKKTKVLDIFNTDKKCFIRINIESSPPKIWIRIRFLQINGSPSLQISHAQYTICRFKFFF